MVSKRLPVRDLPVQLGMGPSEVVNCLMSGHNDVRGTMKVDALSGWLVLQLGDVTKGLFMAWVVSVIITMQ